jgi:hypothetical protein
MTNTPSLGPIPSDWVPFTIGGVRVPHSINWADPNVPGGWRRALTKYASARCALLDPNVGEPLRAAIRAELQSRNVDGNTLLVDMRDANQTMTNSALAARL